MLKNYLKVAYRNITREKGYTVIHIISLGFGMGCFLFLLLLFQYATHFNSNNKNADRIYRVVDHMKSQSGQEVTNALTPMPWGPALKSDFPEVRQYVRLLLLGKTVIQGDKTFNTGITYTDPSIFKVFTFPLAKGAPKNVLNGPSKAVLTQQMARKLFGNSNPMGKTIKINHQVYKITGVLKKLSKHSSVSNSFNILVSTANLNAANFKPVDNWTDHSLETYLLLSKGSRATTINRQMTSFLKHYVGQKSADQYSPSLQPLTQMYLGGSFMNDPHDTLNKSYIYIFLTIGLMILIISCINFINIATARASKRNREVGIRKVIGATGIQLIFQYLSEVFIITLIAFFLANILIEIILPPFNSLSEWNVQVHYLHNPFFWIASIGTILFITLLSGGYPAFYLSRFSPIRIFRSTSSKNLKSLLRAGLVITQFVFAVFMLFSVLIVKKQVGYLFHSDMGYNRQGVVRIFFNGNLRQAKQFQNEISQNTLIKKVSLASNGPFSEGEIKSFFVNQNDNSNGNLVHTFYVDSNYIPLLHLKIIKGRNFSDRLAADTTNSVILNEAAVNKFDWKNKNPIGKQIIQTNKKGRKIHLTVIGVIKNFNYEALNQSIKPLALIDHPQHFSMMIVKADPNHLQAATHFINETWKKNFPDHFFYFQFIQGQIKQWYNTESIISQMLTIITYLTMFIACLGLLGLAAYSTLQRAREISIRKVLGATVRQIVLLLSVEFMQYIGLALLIGLPIAFFAVKMWLHNFAYHVNIGFIPIFLVIFATIFVGWLTIGWQTIKAALANPADNLRNE